MQKQDKLRFPRNPRWIKIPGNYITSRILSPEYAEDYIKKERINPYLASTKEELKKFYSNGGQGIDLSFSETCIVHAIFYIFTVYEYSQEYINFSKNQFYKAFGYKESPCGWESNNLIEKLEILSNKKFPFFWKDKKDRWLTFERIFVLNRANYSNNKFISPRKKKGTVFKIKLNKYLRGNIDNNFRLAVPHLGIKIKEYRNKREERASKYDIRFYDLLLNENKETIEWNYLKIAEGPLLMGNCINDGRKKSIREKLESIYKMYKSLGLLSSYQIDREGTMCPKDVFHLNREKFYKFRETKSNEK